jgi:hypothetical protein
MRPGAPPEPLGSSPWPQEPASGRAQKTENNAPLSTSRQESAPLTELFTHAWRVSLCAPPRYPFIDVIGPTAG